MKKTIRLTESDLMRIVKRVINEQYPDDFNAWASRDFSPGSPTYERDMETHIKGRERDRQSAIGDRKNLVIPNYYFIIFHFTKIIKINEIKNPSVGRGLEYFLLHIRFNQTSYIFSY